MTYKELNKANLKLHFFLLLSAFALKLVEIDLLYHSF